MTSKNRIIWLASYPKSGSTWFRVFLTNLFQEGKNTLNINALSVPWGISRHQFDHISGLDSSLLSRQEMKSLWPQVVTNFAATLDCEPKYRILKTHGAYLSQESNPFFVAETIERAIYLVRNPLDVCVSFSHHSNWSIDHTIKVMADKHHSRHQSYSAWKPSFKETVSSWSNNVNSWLREASFPVHFMRYEDMLRDPRKMFSEALQFLQFPIDTSLIERCIAQSDFKALQKQERESGFQEKSAKTEQFFRCGQSGNWKSRLSKKQIHALLNEHDEVMQTFAYCPD